MIVYTTGCAVCEGVKNYLKSNNISFETVENYEEIIKVAEENKLEHLPIVKYNEKYYEGRQIIDVLKQENR